MIHAADHNYTGTAKIVPSVICDFNIGRDPSESLLSGGENENGTIYVAVHDGVFQMSNNYRHMASIVRVLQKRCISMLVEDDLLPKSSLGVNYHDLCRPQQNVVKESMPLVFGNEFDGGGDHSNTNFQNMLAYIGGFFLIGCDRFFLNRCCPGKV